VKFVRPRQSESVRKLISALESAPTTYSEVGATLSARQPPGYRNDAYERVLGHGPECFQRAVQGLQTWQQHQVPGIRVLPKGTKIRPGATVVVALGASFLALAAPCRIIEVVDGPGRWGFAYGTLPGHPEQGEEAFLASIDGTGKVWFRIVAFSRPADPVARLSGPIGRAVQKAGTHGYLQALQRFVDETG
jgi:uncharacterized protein (UPF0548 family)